MVIHCWHYSCDKLFYLTISSTAAAEPIPIVQVTDCLCVCVDVVRLFFKSLSSSNSLCLILTKLCTRDLCQYAKKDYGTDFRNFDFKIFGKFFKLQSCT